MRKCACCGVRMVRQWPYHSCGACFRDQGWTEERYEDELRAVMRQMDPRLRSLPFFTPLGPPKKKLADEVEELS